MKHRFLYIMALLLTAATDAWAQDPDPIELTPSADGTVWTLATMPDYDVELEVTYYTDEELDQLAADEVIAKINAIGTVEYTPECKALIDAARTAYDALTDAQKALVTNYPTLTAAEAKYAELEAAAAEAQFAEGVELAQTGTNEWTLAETPGFDIELEVEYETELALNEVDDNAATLDEWDGYEADVTLTRTLQAGGYNTFAVPFNMAIPEGWTVKELNTASIAGQVLTLNFADATTIEAGKPYLVKVAAQTDLSQAAFAGAIVSKETQPYTSATVDFIPTLGATDIETDDVRKILFFGAENTLYRPNSTSSRMKGFRAYFQLKEAAEVKGFELNFGDETTGIKTIEHSPLNIDHSVYDLLGRKVNGQSSMVNGQLQKGVYIVSGKKLIIK